MSALQRMQSISRGYVVAKKWVIKCTVVKRRYNRMCWHAAIALQAFLCPFLLRTPVINKFNLHFECNINADLEVASISISRPISILDKSHYELETDIDTSFLEISRQYRYDIDISAFFAISTSICISNQSVSHISAV